MKSSELDSKYFKNIVEFEKKKQKKHGSKLYTREGSKSYSKIKKTEATDTKTFCKTISFLYFNKAFGSTDITLIAKEVIISDDQKRQLINQMQI